MIVAAVLVVIVVISSLFLVRRNKDWSPTKIMVLMLTCVSLSPVPAPNQADKLKTVTRTPCRECRPRETTIPA